MKKRNVFLLGLLVVLLAMGLVLVGCDKDDDSSSSNNSGSGNPFIGTWRSPEGGGYYVLVFTEFDWTITSPTGNRESGYYNWLQGQTSVTMTMTQGGSGTYNVSISGNTLSFGSRTYTKS